MCSINGEDGLNWVARRETFESEFPELCTPRGRGDKHVGEKRSAAKHKNRKVSWIIYLSSPASSLWNGFRIIVELLDGEKWGRMSSEHLEYYVRIIMVLIYEWKIVFCWGFGCNWALLLVLRVIGTDNTGNCTERHTRRQFTATLYRKSPFGQSRRRSSHKLSFCCCWWNKRMTINHAAEGARFEDQEMRENGS